MSDETASPRIGPPIIIVPTARVEPRPTVFKDLCFTSFVETTIDNLFRNPVDDSSAVLARRKRQRPTRTATASINIPQSQVEDFRTWHDTTCKSGIFLTRFKLPNGTEEPWGFNSPPVYAWQMGPAQGKHRCEITFELIQAPAWKTL